MTRPLDDTGTGTPGLARATFGTLSEPTESRSITFLPGTNESEFMVCRLMDGREVWRSLSGMKPVKTTMCEWVRDARET